MRILLFSILTFCCSVFSFGNGDEFYNELVEKGNLAYDNGEYDSSITFYSQVVNSDFQSSTLFYNLGNAYFKDKQLAPAIYYYEKALKLSPSHPDIRFNLEMANSQIVDKVSKKPVPIMDQAYLGISSLLTPNQWGYITDLLFVLLLLFLAAYLLSGSITLKRLSFYGSMGLLLLFVISFTVGQMVKNRLLNEDQAIVFTGSLTVKAEPRLTSSDLFVIHEGTKVAVLETGEIWLRIALPDGNEGWARKSDVKLF